MGVERLKENTVNAVVAQPEAAKAGEIVRMPQTSEEAAFSLRLRKAKAYASSTLVPKTYQNNVANVLIAMDVADRIGANELMVMQNLNVVQGRPSWSSSFLIATVNSCGRFTPMRFEVYGADPTKPDYRVRAFAEDKASGEKCIGSWITWALVKAEGWLDKNGSKWKTMPEQMFLYRAAGFWSRVYAPEVSMGILTREEVEDVWGGADAHATVQTPVNQPGTVEALKGALLEHEPPKEGEQITDVLPVTAQGVHDALTVAQDGDSLDAAADLIRMLPEDEHEPLNALYSKRKAELPPQ
jgi:hypothetical protein